MYFSLVLGHETILSCFCMCFCVCICCAVPICISVSIAIQCGYPFGLGPLWYASFCACVDIVFAADTAQWPLDFHNNERSVQFVLNERLYDSQCGHLDDKHVHYMAGYCLSLEIVT